MKISGLAIAFALVSSSAARADDSTITALAGGGVSTFADRAMRDVLSSRVGVWYAGMAFGSHSSLELDASYLGSAANLRGRSDGDRGILEGTALEAAVRYNMAPTAAWNPYVMVGAGWQHYRVRSATFDLSDAGMNRADDLAAFPIGVGMSYRDAIGLVVDVRSVVRPTTTATLVRVDSSTYASMYSWELSAAIGYQL